MGCPDEWAFGLSGTNQSSSLEFGNTRPARAVLRCSGRHARTPSSLSTVLCGRPICDSAAQALTVWGRDSPVSRAGEDSLLCVDWCFRGLYSASSGEALQGQAITSTSRLCASPLWDSRILGPDGPEPLPEPAWTFLLKADHDASVHFPRPEGWPNDSDLGNLV